MIDFLKKLFEKITDLKPGAICAGIFFAVALLLCIFGILKTLFILFFTAVGFFVGSFFFNDNTKLKKLLDKILPPGRFR